MAGLLSRASDAYGWREMRSVGRTPWVLTGGTLLTGVGRGIAAPFIVIYLVESRHVPLSVVGLAITLEFLVRALVGPLAGSLSDRVGRKPLMVAGLLGTTILVPAYLLVTDARGLLVVATLIGLFAANSLYGPASVAMVADVVAPNRRGSVYGLIHASRNLGWTVGIALGAALYALGFAPIFLVAGVLPFAYLFVVLLLVQEPTIVLRERPRMFAAWRRLFASRLFVAYLVLTIAFDLGWGQMNSIFPLWITAGLGLPA